MFDVLAQNRWSALNWIYRITLAELMAYMRYEKRTWTHEGHFMGDSSVNTIWFRFDSNSDLPNASIQLVDLSCVSSIFKDSSFQNRNSLCWFVYEIWIDGWINVCDCKKVKRKIPGKISFCAIDGKVETISHGHTFYRLEQKVHILRIHNRKNSLEQRKNVLDNLNL